MEWGVWAGWLNEGRVIGEDTEKMVGKTIWEEDKERNGEGDN